MKRGEKVFVLVDSDPHRDDVVRVFEDETRALREAGMAVKAQVRGTNRTLSDELRDSMRVEGWRFFVRIGEEGRSVSVIHGTLE